MCQRSGLGRIELLVILVVLGSLLSFLPPAVLGLLQAGEREKAADKLKQILLAVHNVNDAFKKFPPAAGTFGAIQTNDQSISVHLLPYIEQANTYNEIVKTGKPSTTL